MNSGSAGRAALRQRLRRLRRELSPAARRAAEVAVARLIQRAFNLRPGLRIAVYAPLRGELDPAALVRLAQRHRCRLYVPHLMDLRRRRMQFVEARGPMRRNALGILEPVQLRRLSTHSLDLVFVPLVGFDATGARLGMGAGYYDRAFAFLRLRRYWFHPRLIGVAYSIQQVPHIEHLAHDVRLHRVVTEKGVIKCSTGY